ncbi:helix-turn-helix domain-containing protein [Aquisphaera insulae]|uniref:helix-turn-helix domain-containing protein n=1 Tax=Aquisphaera insulae TaxID=2712864 RepID=UPI0013EA58BB|nr:XRE family transcriptional regulator [Aquisphaera insulae]
MALDAITLGRRLKEARENRRLTQEEAAQAIALSRTALVHIESGKRSLSTLELSGLAKLYHRSVMDFFAEGESQASREEDPLLILHRLPPELLDDQEVNRQVSRCVELCSIGVHLEATLGLDDAVNLPAYEYRAPTRPSEATRQGEKVAEDERRRLGLGYGPIADMADVISTQGIWASGVKGLPDDMSGIFLRHSSIGLVVLVNYGHLRARKRFSYAHEYAHALLDRKTTSAIVTREQNRQDYIERRANAFAAAFLMPETGVRWFMETLEKGGPSRRQRITYSSAGDEPVEAEERPAAGSQQITYQDVVALANHFGVSYPAATYRLNDLGYLNAREKESLLQRSSLGFRLLESSGSNEDGQPQRKPDRELVSQITRLAVEAYRREEVSQGWLRDLSDKLDMPAKDLIEQAEAATEC